MKILQVLNQTEETEMLLPSPPLGLSLQPSLNLLMLDEFFLQLSLEMAPFLQSQLSVFYFLISSVKL